jgi:hypothetical protein
MDGTAIITIAAVRGLPLSHCAVSKPHAARFPGFRPPHSAVGNFRYVDRDGSWLAYGPNRAFAVPSRRCGLINAEHTEGGEVTVQQVPPKAPHAVQSRSWRVGSSIATDGRDQPLPPLLFPDTMPDFGTEPLPTSLKLPRGRVIGRDPIKKTFTYREYPLGREGLGLLPTRAACRTAVPQFPTLDALHGPQP